MSRGLCKVLIPRQFPCADGRSGLHDRQIGSGFSAFFRTLFIQHRKTVEGNLRAGGFKEVIPGQNIGLGGVHQAVAHLAGHKALPDQRIQFILVTGQTALDLLRLQPDRGGTDGFMAVLGVGPGFKVTFFIRNILAAKLIINILPYFANRVL